MVNAELNRGKAGIHVPGKNGPLRHSEGRLRLGRTGI